MTILFAISHCLAGNLLTLKFSTIWQELSWFRNAPLNYNGKTLPNDNHLLVMSLYVLYYNMSIKKETNGGYFQNETNVNLSEQAFGEIHLL